MFWILHFIFSQALAAPPALTYQGRIVKSDGQPLQAASVSFQFEITSSNGACVLYREQVNGINMQNSNGIFDVPIGNSHSYPASATFTILDSFNNSGTMTCDGGAPYSPTLDAGRLLRVQFHDGISWKLISPDTIVRSVPFAGYADSAAKLGSNLPSDFVLKSEINSDTSCGSGSFLTWNATTRQFGCDVAPTGGGGGSGTVTNVTSANSYLSITNGTTTPQLTVNVGTGVNTVAAGNDSRFTDARNPTGAASGDLSGNYPSPTVAKIQGRAIDSTAPSDGQVLLWDNGNSTWKAQFVRAQDLRTAWGGTQMIPSTACAANESMVWSVITDRFTCQTIALNASAITAGTINSARLGSGTADNTTYLRGDGTWQTISTSDSTKLPLAGGTMTGNIAMGGNKITGVGNVPFTAANPTGTEDGKTLRWNNTSGLWEWFTAGVAGAGIATLNGLSGTTQTLAPTSSATSYGFNSTGTSHTLVIPSAGTAGVTAGTISKTEYDAFNGKQAAGNYITALTGDMTLSGFAAGSATATIASNAVTTGKINDGAVTTAKIADGNITGAKLENSGVTAGTYTKVTVDAKGRITVGDTLAAADIPNLDAAKITSGTLHVARLGSGTADNTTYLRGDGTWSTPTFTESDPQVGANTTDYLSKWNGSALVTSAVYENSGNVGIGTNSPGAKLEIVGQIKITGGTPGANKVLTSDAAGLATWEALPAASNVSLTSAVTGVLPVANGGTNSSTALNNNRLMASVSGAIQELGALTDGQVVVGKNSSAPQIVTLGGDASISNTGSLTIATSAVTTGKILDGTVAVGDLNFAGTMATNTGLVVRDGTQFYNKTCSGNEVLIWSVANGWICSAVTLTESDPQVGANTTNYLPKWNGSALVSSAIYQDASGLVGLGTASPTHQLEITAAATQTPQIFLTNTTATDYTQMAFASASRQWNIGIGNGSESATGVANKFFLWDNNASAMRMVVDTSGNVGIGTTSPSAKLEVNGDQKNNGRVGLGVDPATTVAGYSSKLTSAATSADWNATFLAFGANASGASNAFTKSRNTTFGSHTIVQSHDIVGINYYYGSDGSNYQEAATISAVIDGTPGTGDMPGRLVFATTADGAATATERMRITNSGSIGVGTTTPASKLQVNGAITNTVSTFSGAFTCGTSSLDFGTSNFLRLSPSGAIAAGTCNVTLANLVAGGSYTLVVTGNAATNAVTYNFTGYTFKYLPANTATTSGKDTIYTFVYDGSTVYVTWAGGY